MFASQAGVTTLTLNRPRFYNCLDGSIVHPLAAFLRRGALVSSGQIDGGISGIHSAHRTDITWRPSRAVNDGAGAGLVVVRGAGPALSTGGDLLMGRNIIARWERWGSIRQAERLYLVRHIFCLL